MRPALHRLFNDRGPHVDPAWEGAPADRPEKICVEEIEMVLPQQQGLYDPAHEHDACGVGFVVNIKNRKSHAIIEQGLQI
ncbi:MAG: hypothetical protein M9884_17670, partial [Rhodocyclaceae bacterium]|nr:hypothetical protein [Rhodocyclaceae bacterium]